MRSGLAVVPLMLLLGGCTGANAASRLATLPQPAGEDVAADNSRLIAALPNTERSRWEDALEHRRTIVVQAVGKDLVLLDDCNVPGGYDYHGGSAQTDTYTLQQSDGLQTGSPWGRAGLEKTGESYIDTTIVGQWTANRKLVRGELRDECRNATHFVSVADVGAFTLYAKGAAHIGAEGGVGGLGGGGTSDARREALSRAGDEGACTKAAAGNYRPPDGCDVPIRIQLDAIEDVQCPKGQQWNGSKCADEGAAGLALLALLLAL